MTFYHYTAVEHLARILPSGVLRPTESNVSALRAHAGPDVVWLLDETADLSLDHGLERSGGDKKEVRFQVDVPAIRWLDWEPTQLQMAPAWRDILIEAGGGREAAEHWYVWPAPIRCSRWLEMALRDTRGIYVPHAFGAGT